MSTPHYYEYRIKPGENLSLIIVRFYNIGPRSASYRKCIENILVLNPHIKNPNMIHAGAILRLMPTPMAEVKSTLLKQGSRNTTFVKETRSNFIWCCI